MFDQLNYCQAGRCMNPAIVRVKGVALCSHHVEQVNEQIDGSYRRFYTLGAQTIREIVSAPSGGGRPTSRSA